MSQLLGIDAGNTMIKAVLFDLRGRVQAVAECAGETQQSQPGYADRRIDDIWQGVCQAVRGCLQQAGSDGRDIIAVGAAGHGNGLYVLDRQQQPLCGIQSIDQRAIATAQALIDSGAAASIHQLSLQQPWPAATPVLIRWIRDNQPDLWAQAGHLLCAKDVIVHFLSGVIGTDYSDAAGAGLIDYRLRSYSETLLALYGIADALPRLPALRESCAVAGRVTAQAARLTGLPAGIPVVAGLFDVIASAVGSGVVNCGEASIVAGTWSINQVVVEKPHYLRPVFMNAIVENDRYMAIEASATSAANLDWFLREFDDGRSGQGAGRSSDSVALVQPNPQLPLYHPYLYAGRKAEPAKAGFYGLGGWHTRADMLFALFEGVTFAHRAHIDRLRAAGLAFRQANLSGGATRSSVWPQMFADVLNIPIRVAGCKETGALGAALCAGVGAGVWPNLTTAVQHAVPLSAAALQPRPDRVAFHDARYRRFKKLELAMRDIWSEAG
ncbi:FGGY-family carbohydrate kinase [Candidatus Pantoea soli]|uniref:Carbohydrate kinase n=1 Tax=Candidatus Pantoea soli TaxID=3098669 RepID=A0A518XCM2_9GAMM|nr:FGGY-family carbohydrate kinase [Pantoea soli]QDY41941.1 carbohydrate kinase [Pantoea soli]